jgi:hypothetical protein
MPAVARNTISSSAMREALEAVSVTYPRPKHGFFKQKNANALGFGVYDVWSDTYRPKPVEGSRLELLRATLGMAIERAIEALDSLEDFDLEPTGDDEETLGRTEYDQNVAIDEIVERESARLGVPYRRSSNL